jgi:hypothetical protein
VIPQTIATLDVKMSDRHGAPAVMVRHGDDRDVPGILSMNAPDTQSYRFRLVRDRDLTHYAIAKKRLLAGLGPPDMRAVHFVVAEEGVSAAAYVVVTRDAHGWMLEECGDRDPSGARVGAILQTLLARDPAEARPRIAAWLPSRFLPPQVTVVETASRSEVMMVRPLSARAKAAMPLRGDDVLYWHGDVF